MKSTSSLVVKCGGSILKYSNLHESRSYLKFNCREIAIHETAINYLFFLQELLYDSINIT